MKALIAIVLVLLLAGCHKDAPAEPVARTAPEPNPAIKGGLPKPDTEKLLPATPTPDPSVASPSPSGDTGRQPPAAKLVGPSLDAIPAELKSPAFEYYGLGNDKPIDYELTGDESAGVRTGSLTTTLKSVKDGKASFVQIRSGGLYLLGNDEVMLDSVGVHVTSSTVESFDPDNLEFPADVSPGKSWKSHDKITQSGLTLEVTSKSTIVGVRPVKTKRGTLQGLLVTSTSDGSENGQKLHMDSETYYVKGIGLVKAVIKTTQDKGKHSTITQQLAD